MYTSHSSDTAPARHRASGPGPAVRALAALLLASSLAVAGCGASRDSGSDSAAARPGTQQKADGKAPAAGPDGAPAGPATGTEGAGGAAGAALGAGGDGSQGTPAAGAKRGSDKGTPSLSGVHIVRTASLTVRVKDVPKAVDEARASVTGAGGYVGSESTDRDTHGRERSRLVLRVPQEHYDEVLAALSGTGTLVSRSVEAEDVTDEVVDVDSRVSSQRASVARVRGLMDQATDLSDIVSPEGELSSRQADLESLLARQAALKDRTSLATVTLSLSSTASAKQPAPPAHGGTGFLDALEGGWHGLLTVLRWLAVVVGAVLPFAVPLALLLLLWTRVIRPRRARLFGPWRPQLAGARPPGDGNGSEQGGGDGHATAP
ncbi:DUF4349 domain-containing protein [Streptomyces sp. TS71-3]|uniref:DUF4349 domain-containing protein n=1 Tax=Streptomyces sp. TS71-3 TaxID=2733862 RepID=UPI001B06F6F4|nr:DUF4349 domain-containing protein [Streptomyces sp. TS71-3]GHJ40855.1 hypothetical protein Sm713_64640 [Streptomyces sp. TS71-3]